MFTQLTDLLITSITGLYIETGLIGIFLIMALENCYVPLPPSEVIIPIAGILITRGDLLSGIPFWVSIPLVSLTGAFGCLIGSMAAYGIGSAGGRQLLFKYGRFILISQHDVERADQFFQRWGSATIFYSRLVPVVRTWASLPAGLTKMPFIKFCIYTLFGSLLWCTLWTCLGIILGNNIDRIKPISSALSALVFVTCTILIVLYIWNRIRTIYHDRGSKTPQL